MHARGNFGGLEHHGVADRQGHCDGAHAQDHRSVPGRDPKHHARGLPDRHGQITRLVRRNDLAGDLGGQGGGFTQHAGRQEAVESAPGRRPAGFLGDQADELGRGRFQGVGGGVEDLAPLGGALSRPFRKGLGGGVHRGAGVLDAGGGGHGDHIAGDGIAALKGGASGGGDILAADQERNIRRGHGFLQLSGADGCGCQRSICQRFAGRNKA